MAWEVLNNELFQDTDQDLETKLETGLGINFKSVNMPLYTIIEQTRANLINLLLTTKGERVMLPTFGSDLLRIIFEPNLTNIKELIANTISESIAQWLPYVIINDLEIQTNEDDSNLNHHVQVKLTWSITEFDSDDIIEFTSDGNNVSVA